jgi:hypothetical protein
METCFSSDHRLAVSNSVFATVRLARLICPCLFPPCLQRGNVCYPAGFQLNITTTRELRLSSLDNTLLLRFPSIEARSAFRRAIHAVARELKVSYYKCDEAGTVLVDLDAGAVPVGPVDHSNLPAHELEALQRREHPASPSTVSITESARTPMRLIVQAQSGASAAGLRDTFRETLLSVRCFLASCTFACFDRCIFHAGYSVMHIEAL